MPIEYIFWILMLFWLVFGFWSNYDPTKPWFRYGGPHLLTFILFGILGWQVFGAAIKR